MTRQFNNLVQYHSFYVPASSVYHEAFVTVTTNMGRGSLIEKNVLGYICVTSLIISIHLTWLLLSVCEMSVWGSCYLLSTIPLQSKKREGVSKGQLFMFVLDTKYRMGWVLEKFLFLSSWQSVPAELSNMNFCPFSDPKFQSWSDQRKRSPLQLE